MAISMMTMATTIVSPAQSYAQVIVQSSKNHKGPDSATTTLSSQGQGNGNGRHGHGVPHGLLNAWAHSNMSVVARAVTHAIFLNGTHGVELAEIAINASSNGQLIKDIANNESVVEVEFDHDGAVELHVNSTEKPSMIFADDNQLTEVETADGNMTSNTWAYNQNNHMLTVDADPSSITIVYGTYPTPVLEFPSGGTIAVIALVALASALFLLKRKQLNTRKPTEVL